MYPRRNPIYGIFGWNGHTYLTTHVRPIYILQYGYGLCIIYYINYILVIIYLRIILELLWSIFLCEIQGSFICQLQR